MNPLFIHPQHKHRPNILNRCSDKQLESANRTRSVKSVGHTQVSKVLCWENHLLPSMLDT